MTWNHRVIHSKYQVPLSDPPEYTHVYAIHEVYYNDAGKIYGVTENADTITGESIEDLKQTIQRYTEALSKPILDFNAIEYVPSHETIQCEKCVGTGWFGHGMGGDTCDNCNGTGKVTKCAV